MPGNGGRPKKEVFFERGYGIINILNVAVILAIIAPLFLFSELARWQKIGYVIGTVLWLTNLMFVGSFGLGTVAVLVLLVSCAQLICDYFPIRP